MGDINIMNNELEFYNEVKDWDFSKIKYKEESLTNWDMYDILSKKSTKNSYILDLGTGGGEKLLSNFPKAKRIIGTDLSAEMIKTAQCNLEKSKRRNIEFKVMDNLKMDFENDYFDIIVARHTRIDAKQIYRCLKKNGILLLRGVDQLDCFELKKIYGKGQAYNDIKPISHIDYENILEAGFRDVELVPIHIREYYETENDLIALLLKTPILQNFSEAKDSEIVNNKLDFSLLNKYIEKHKTGKGILLIRRYYGIVAYK